MNYSHNKTCRYCGGPIQLLQMPTGQWVALEEAGKIHHCRRSAGRDEIVKRSSVVRRPEQRPSKPSKPSKPSRPSREDIFKDLPFPNQFILKNEIDRNQKRAGSPLEPSRPKRRRNIKRQVPHFKLRRNSRKSSNGRFFLLSLVVLMILLSLWVHSRL